MTSEARIEANRKNAEKSTGPKTDEGKARSAQNALKHGLAAEAPVLPTETPTDYDEALELWKRDLKPTDMAELALVEQAAKAAQRLKRCLRAENARRTYNARHSFLDFDRQQAAHAHLLGTKLLFDPLNRCTLPKTDPESLRKLNEWRAVEPYLIVKELETFKAGADWMLARWAELEVVLEVEGYWHYPDKFNAIRLLGKRADDGFSDTTVLRLMLSCNALHPEAWTLYDDFKQASLGREGKPVYMLRTDFYKESLPSKEDALTYLREVIAAEKARLLKWKESWLDKQHAQDRQETEARGTVETSPQSVLARRYESACSRDLHRAINTLLKKRKEEAKLRAEESVACEEPVSCDATPEETVVCEAEPEAPNEPNGEAESRPSRAVRRAQKRQKRQQKGRRGRKEGFQDPARPPA